MGKLLFHRVVLVSVSLLVQILLMLIVSFRMADLRPWYAFLMLALRVVYTIHLVSARMDASYKIAWLILILALPVTGVTLYLLLGGNRLSRREKQRMSRMTRFMERELQPDAQVQAQLLERDSAAASQSRYLTDCAVSPVCYAAATEYFSCGEACFPRMLEELRKAKRYIFLEYFIVAQGEMWDTILEILKEKAAAGILVRLLYDDFGSIKGLPAGYAKQLRQFGIEAKAFNPFVPIVSGRLNNRDHRKLMIVDGTVCFTGGINLADEYINRRLRFGYWKDAGLLVRGAAAWVMTVQFLAMWNYVCGPEEPMERFTPAQQHSRGQGFVQPFVDSPLDREQVGQTVLLNLISRAEERVWVMTPYLILDDTVATALCNAAKSGVDVRIITPGIPDKKTVFSLTRANYGALTEAGVRIYEFTPGFLHSKVFLADGKIAVVGTVNLDYRSLYLHYENAVWMYETDCISEIEADFEETFSQCREISLVQAKKVSLPLRAWHAILRLFAPLM